MMKVEAVVVRDRIETVMDAVEEQTGHVGVTVIEAVGHGRQRGITHEYRGRVFESRFLPKALLTFVVPDRLAEPVIDAIVDAIVEELGQATGADHIVIVQRRRDARSLEARLVSSHPGVPDHTTPLPGGDLDRVARQRYFLGAVFRECSDSNTPSGDTRYAEIP